MSTQVNSRKPEPDDFFKYEGKEDGRHYHWPTNDPRRIQEMKRKGYDVVKVKSNDAVHQAQQAQRDILTRIRDNKSTPEKDAVAAQQLLQKLDVAPLDTVSNNQGHVIMQTS